MDIQIANYDLISFDIFDTVLFRAIALPRELHCKVWEQVQVEEIQLSDLTPQEYMKLRFEMEQKARNKVSHREVTLDQIYEELPTYIVQKKERIKQIELEMEKEYCYPNFDMYELIKKVHMEGKTVILVSDMYLDKLQIQELLEHNGIDTKYFDSIIMSCEHLCSKQTGELYDEVFRRYPDISPKRILHIGDNKASDYNQAIKKGIKAYHYNVVPDKSYSIYDYEKIRHNTPQKELLSLRKLAVSSHGEFPDEESQTAFELGASVIGPVMTLYVSWVCERLSKLGIKRIYPLMREGYLLGELIRNEIKNRQTELLVKPIYVSRKVTYIPSIVTINKEEVENLIGARNLTIKESIELVGLDINRFSELVDYFNLYFKEVYKIYFSEGLTVKDYIIERFLEEDNKVKIEKYVKEQRDLLVTYLTQEIGDLHGAATVDIGFFGRIQMWLEQALTMEGISKEFKHFLAVGLTGDKLFNGYQFEGYFSTISENGDLIQTIHRTPDVLEKLISVTEGSTIGYKRDGHQIIPLKSDEVDNKKYLDYVFKGIDTFQSYWFQFKESKPSLAYNVEKNRRETLMILHRFIDMPRYAEAKLLSKFVSDTNFGTNYKKYIITDANRELLENKGVNYIDKCNVSYTYENSNITWPKGLITLYDEFYYLRRALKNQSGNEILKQMQEVVEKVVDDGIEEIGLYGAGENGRQFYFICQLYNIKVNCFIDRKESIWGTLKEGVPVMGLQEAVERGNHNYIITSLFSISEIKDTIEKRESLGLSQLRVYHV